MSKDATGPGRANQRPARAGGTVPKYGMSGKAGWQRGDHGFPAHPLNRLNSSGSSVSGGRQRRDQPARSH